MIKVKCANPDCSKRRAHWMHPEIMREHQYINVKKEEYNKNQNYFCSITCMLEYKAINEQRRNTKTI